MTRDERHLRRSMLTSTRNSRQKLQAIARGKRGGAIAVVGGERRRFHRRNLKILLGARRALIKYSVEDFHYSYNPFFSEVARHVGTVNCPPHRKTVYPLFLFGNSPDDVFGRLLLSSYAVLCF